MDLIKNNEENLNEREGIADCGTLLFTNKDTGEKQIFQTCTDVDFKIKGKCNNHSLPRFKLYEECNLTIEQDKQIEELAKKVDISNNFFDIEFINKVSFENYIKYKEINDTLEKNKIITILPIRKSKSKRIQKKFNKKYGFRVFSIIRTIKFDTINSMF